MRAKRSLNIDATERDILLFVLEDTLARESRLLKDTMGYSTLLNVYDSACGLASMANLYSRIVRE